MAVLSCMVAGEGLVFTVHVDITKPVEELQAAIKAAHPALTNIDTNDIRLFKTTDSLGWMSASKVRDALAEDKVAASMANGSKIKKTISFSEEMHPGKKLNNYMCYGHRRHHHPEEMHVLIKLRDPNDPDSKHISRCTIL